VVLSGTGNCPIMHPGKSARTGARRPPEDDAPANEFDQIKGDNWMLAYSYPLADLFKTSLSLPMVTDWSPPTGSK
jgi:hypothetical protein